jgi:predicted nuclease with TOPRIM domain
MTRYSPPHVNAPKLVEMVKAETETLLRIHPQYLDMESSLSQLYGRIHASLQDHRVLQADDDTIERYVYKAGWYVTLLEKNVDRNEQGFSKLLAELKSLKTKRYERRTKLRQLLRQEVLEKLKKEHAATLSTNDIAVRCHTHFLPGLAN